MGQIKEGMKSCARVAAATAIGGPAVGATALVVESMRSAATAVAGDEGTKAGDTVATAMNVTKAVRKD